uniref:head-tail connector protein n=1 Tax=Phytohabitans flavus TaxID=1076124 RepID=UPI003671E466
MVAITLAEAKAYLRVDNTVEDDLITKLIGSATATVENVLRQPLSAFDFSLMIFIPRFSIP